MMIHLVITGLCSSEQFSLITEGRRPLLRNTAMWIGLAESQ
jgi:hypothetical protein